MQVSESKTRALLRFMAARGYAAYVIDEPCSVRLDGRNLLMLPSERAPKLRSIGAHQLLRVSERSIFGLMPCCRPGQACCPNGPVALEYAWTKENSGVSCCTRKMVERVFKNDAAGRARQQLRLAPTTAAPIHAPTASSWLGRDG